mmetsp:Transcript_77708/g.251455  ORF Transcript_77708/g.251455 Transcript_77708/m.251455 type:complete len:314 (+) Transcript_77708:855-1796(+)
MPPFLTSTAQSSLATLPPGSSPRDARLLAAHAVRNAWGRGQQRGIRRTRSPPMEAKASSRSWASRVRPKDLSEITELRNGTLYPARTRADTDLTPKAARVGADVLGTPKAGRVKGCRGRNGATRLVTRVLSITGVSHATASGTRNGCKTGVHFVAGNGKHLRARDFTPQPAVLRTACRPNLDTGPLRALWANSGTRVLHALRGVVGTEGIAHKGVAADPGMRARYPARARVENFLTPSAAGATEDVCFMPISGCADRCTNRHGAKRHMAHSRVGVSYATKSRVWSGDVMTRHVFGGGGKPFRTRDSTPQPTTA